MNVKMPGSTHPTPLSAEKAFTLVELLVVAGIIGILAALLLTVVSQGKAEAQSAACKSHLRQIGVALTMYTSEAHHYPSLVERSQASNVRAKNWTWADAIYPYYSLSWTNPAWHCPRYIAQGGIIIPQPPMLDIFTSYSYNYRGIVGEGWEGATQRFPMTLGLGIIPMTSAPDSGILAPSEMYAVADARWWSYHHYQETGLAGKWNMSPWQYVYHISNPTSSWTVTHVETPPPHGQGYNMLFCDGHVALVKRSDYLYPPRTARHWNRDNQPHPEAWAPTGDWVVQQ
jgi:prepilin-type processing-associated H-X9-DG protein/prepilin-type N-terminal cleavage/methylation domain-containing protein